MRKIKVAVFGCCGVVAGVCIRSLAERKIDVVAGFEVRNIGEDLGEEAGIGHTGVKVSDVKNAPAILKELCPDIALDCTLNTIEEIYPHAKMCLENGVNYMPVGVCCYDPFDTDPELAKELDEIGKRTGATFLGSGSAEVWQSLPMVVSSLGNKIDRITLDFNALLNEFGEECLEGCEFGLEKDKWNTLPEEVYPSAFYPVMRLLAEKAGLHITEYRQVSDFAAAEEDIDVDRLNVHIKKGTLCDYISRDIIHTAEGVEMITQSHYKFGIEGEKNSFVVTIEGEPGFRMEVEDFHGDFSTSTIMVNRIPDVVAAPGGILLVNDLPVITYKSASAFEIND